MLPIKGPSVETLRALESAPNMYLVLSPDLYILTASDLYLEATETKREVIAGKHIFEAFPDNPEIPDIDGVQNINASLQEVLRTGKAHYMRIQRYDVPDVNNPGKFIQRYWDPSHTPVFDEQGEISYIIQHANNITEKVLTEQALYKSRLQQQETFDALQGVNKELFMANEELQDTQGSLYKLNIELEERIATRTSELAASESKFRSMIEQSPVAMQVFRGEDMTFEVVNDAMLRFLGKSADIIGKPLFVGVPEIVGQPIVERLYHVYHTGEPLELKAEKVLLHRNGKEETGYYDVIYRALCENSRIKGVLGIAIDVTEQKQDEQRKNDFITMVSHELKTPLTSLKAYLQMLEAKAKRAQDNFTAGALDRANKQVNKMTTMINGFLNVSRLESGKIHIDKQRFDMALLVKESEEESITTITSHKVIFAPVEPTFVIADRDKIGQVINNFISNAVKYSPSGSTVSVACVTANGMAKVSVKDEGMGIAPQELDKLFGRYYRAENVKVSTIAGFGIGLYLCAEIIQRHDGKIWAESKLGEGSTFYFCLPVELPAGTGI